jgi:hypothetical protein
LFTEKYIKLCGELGIKLAENCERNEKAKHGKILGIIFDSEKMAWRIPDDKIYKTMSAIDLALNADETSLLEMQKLMGRLNDICLMCPFLNGFKRSLKDDLGDLQRTQIRAKVIS